MPSSSEFRRRAREALRGKWPMAAVISYVATLLGAHAAVGGFNFNFDFNFDLDPEQYSYTELLRNMDPMVRQFLQGLFLILLIVLGVAVLLSIAQFILGGPVSLGYCKCTLGINDGKEAEFSTLFSQFDRFREGFIMHFLMRLFIALWSLLFVIPGIIKTYSYAMTPYILAENPQFSPKEAITKSRQLMDGHKSELFCLELSFIGWALLSCLVPIVGGALVTTYAQVSYAAFYRHISRCHTDLYHPDREQPEQAE